MFAKVGLMAILHHLNMGCELERKCDFRRCVRGSIFRAVGRFWMLLSAISKNDIHPGITSPLPPKVARTGVGDTPREMR